MLVTARVSIQVYLAALFALVTLAISLSTAALLYDLCDADPPQLREHKVATKDAFDLGRLAYAHGDFTEAYRYFHEVAKHTDDHAAAYFRDRSAIMASAVQSTAWDGIEHMGSK